MEQKAGILIAHSGARRVTFDELLKLPAAEPTGPRHCPIPHSDIIKATRTELQKCGFDVRGEEISIQGDKAEKLFAVFNCATDLPGTKGWHDNGGLTEDHTGINRLFALGLRHANDSTWALRMTVGSRVLVCDNLAFSGDEYVLKRKHTSGVRLNEEIYAALGTSRAKYITFERNFQQLQAHKLTTSDAQHYIYEAIVVKQVLAVQHLPKVHQWYFEPETPAIDCSDRTLFGLHNAFTRAIKELPSPALQYRASQNVGKYFGLSSETELVPA